MSDESHSRITQTIAVRGYELDRTGAVPATVLMRYMEHARWEGLRRGGVLEDMFQGGRRIVVRQQRLTVVGRLGYPSTVRVGLWIERVGRTSLEMGHDVLREDGTPVARASVIAVQLDASWRPAEVSAAVRALAVDGGKPDTQPVLRGGAPGGAYTASLVVRPHEIDLLQHVNHSFYAEYFDDVRLSAAADGAYGGLERAAAPAREVVVDYVASALPGDVMRVATWVHDGPAGRVAFELQREDGTLLSHGVIGV